MFNHKYTILFFISIMFVYQEDCFNGYSKHLGISIINVYFTGGAGGLEYGFGGGPFVPLEFTGLPPDDQLV